MIQMDKSVHWKSEMSGNCQLHHPIQYPLAFNPTAHIIFYGLNAKPDSLPFIPCIWVNWHLILSSIKPSFPLSIIGTFYLVTPALVPRPMQLLIQASLLESPKLDGQPVS
eukprot:TRINITY_DN44657_c0_g1_i1.p1 TRINITY_DN44657_c0_g1~~TRINITY_DN44657_c0_g1_i1.p1  ORF type:complete len:110 (-),score=9.89 TRINITY_DN44657_c0_g1_i1:274-603(-)